MDEVRIREARLEDLSTAAELLGELEHLQTEWRFFVPRSGARAEILARYRAAVSDPNALHLVAESNGAVVGMALASIHTPSSVSNASSVEISSFVVRASHRGRGIGRALAARLVAFARERGVSRLDLAVFAQNEEAVAFWTRLGFRPRLLQMVADASALDPTGPDSLPAS